MPWQPIQATWKMYEKYSDLDSSYLFLVTEIKKSLEAPRKLCWLYFFPACKLVTRHMKLVKRQSKRMRTSSAWLQMPSTQEPYRGADQAALSSHSKGGLTKFHKDFRVQRTELNFGLVVVTSPSHLRPSAGRLHAESNYGIHKVFGKRTTLRQSLQALGWTLKGWKEPRSLLRCLCQHPSQT